MKIIELNGNLENNTVIDLGNMEHISAIVSGLARALSAGKDTFMIEWQEKSRIPRGAIIKGQEIGWTQHGIVSSITGQQIGYYERVVDDLNQDTQIMLIFA